MTRPIEARCKSHSRIANGGRNIRFEFGKDDAAVADLIEPGQRYALALVPISDNEQQQPEKLKQSPDTSLETVHEEPARQNPLSRRAGILAQDEQFWIFSGSNNALDAASYIRLECKVKSRSEIERGTEAAKLFDQLISKYLAWRVGPHVGVS